MRILLGLLILALVGCNPETEGGNQSHKNGDFTIKIIDGYDGRGHKLATYDGEEREETIDNITYYLYRTN